MSTGAVKTGKATFGIAIAPAQESFEGGARSAASSTPSATAAAIGLAAPRPSTGRRLPRLPSACRARPPSHPAGAAPSPPPSAEGESTRPACSLGEAMPLTCSVNSIGQAAPASSRRIARRLPCPSGASTIRSFAPHSRPTASVAERSAARRTGPSVPLQSVREGPSSESVAASSPRSENSTASGPGAPPSGRAPASSAAGGACSIRNRSSSAPAAREAVRTSGPKSYRAREPSLYGTAPSSAAVAPSRPHAAGAKDTRHPDPGRSPCDRETASSSNSSAGSPPLPGDSADCGRSGPASGGAATVAGAGPPAHGRSTAAAAMGSPRRPIVRSAPRAWASHPAHAPARGVLVATYL